jgi:membrane associated rhomboid family serine protease
LVSKQARNLIIAIVAGLAAGVAMNPFYVNGTPLLLYFIQFNALVYRGWVPSLVTSLVVAPPSSQGVLDVFFNAISVYFVDGLLSVVYTSKQYYATFIATGVFGNLISLLNGSAVASFGASGGIFGLVAGAVSFDYAFNRRVNNFLLLWFLFIFIYSSFAASDIDWLAHAGGSLLGLAIGFMLGSQRRKQYIYGTVYRRYTYP